MADAHDWNIATLELTKEILTELEVPAYTRGTGAQAKASSDRIEAYAECFRQLFKGLTAPGEE